MNTFPMNFILGKNLFLLFLGIFRLLEGSKFEISLLNGVISKMAIVTSWSYKKGCFTMSPSRIENIFSSCLPLMWWKINFKIWSLDIHVIDMFNCIFWTFSIGKVWIWFRLRILHSQIRLYPTFWDNKFKTAVSKTNCPVFWDTR